MIAPGGPRICGACRTLAHDPRPDCPAPYLADPNEFDPFNNQKRRKP